VKDLESDVRYYKARAERGEQSLARVQREIQEKFFGPNATASSPDSQPTKG
jgi:hypothetical protein